MLNYDLKSNELIIELEREKQNAKRNLFQIKFEPFSKFYSPRLRFITFPFSHKGRAFDGSSLFFNLKYLMLDFKNNQFVMGIFHGKIRLNGGYLPTIIKSINQTKFLKFLLLIVTLMSYV